MTTRLKPGIWPRWVPQVLPWWWNDFIDKLNTGRVYAKGDKGDKGDPGISELPGRGFTSNPPAGCKKVTNIYVNQDGKIVVEYDDVS